MPTPDQQPGQRLRPERKVQRFFTRARERLRGAPNSHQALEAARHNAGGGGNGFETHVLDNDPAVVAQATQEAANVAHRNVAHAAGRVPAGSEPFTRHDAVTQDPREFTAAETAQRAADRAMGQRFKQWDEHNPINEPSVATRTPAQDSAETTLRKSRSSAQLQQAQEQAAQTIAQADAAAEQLHADQAAYADQFAEQQQAGLQPSPSEQAVRRNDDDLRREVLPYASGHGTPSQADITAAEVPIDLPAVGPVSEPGQIIDVHQRQESRHLQPEPAGEDGLAQQQDEPQSAVSDTIDSSVVVRQAAAYAHGRGVPTGVDTASGVPPVDLPVVGPPSEPGGVIDVSAAGQTAAGPAESDMPAKPGDGQSGDRWIRIHGDNVGEPSRQTGTTPAQEAEAVALAGTRIEARRQQQEAADEHMAQQAGELHTDQLDYAGRVQDLQAAADEHTAQQAENRQVQAEALAERERLAQQAYREIVQPDDGREPITISPDDTVDTVLEQLYADRQWNRDMDQQNRDYVAGAIDVARRLAAEEAARRRAELTTETGRAVVGAGWRDAHGDTAGRTIQEEPGQAQRDEEQRLLNERAEVARQRRLLARQRMEDRGLGVIQQELPGVDLHQELVPGHGLKTPAEVERMAQKEEEDAIAAERAGMEIDTNTTEEQMRMDRELASMVDALKGGKGVEIKGSRKPLVARDRLRAAPQPAVEPPKPPEAEPVHEASASNIVNMEEYLSDPDRETLDKIKYDQFVPIWEQLYGSRYGPNGLRSEFQEAMKRYDKEAKRILQEERDKAA